MLSLATIVALFGLAIFAPLLRTINPLTQHYDALDLGPGPQHWFGTDSLGRDQYSRLLYGLRVPLLAGLVGAAITTIVGTLLGVMAGYFGGPIDTLLSRFTDLIFAFPGFTLALIVVSVYGNALDSVIAGAGRLLTLIVVFGLVGWPSLMRFVRSLTLSMKEQQFIEAARTCGTSHTKIIFSHLLPNMWGLILVQAGFIVISFVYTEATLSNFGLGVEPPNPDLEQMLYNGTSNMGVSYWEVLFPSAFLGIIASVATRVVVMYGGRVMETGSVAEIFYRPTHPYTHALLASIPRLDQPRGEPLRPIPGRPADLVNPAPGCPFAPRCPFALPVCRVQMPALEAANAPGHQVACWNPLRETAA